MSQTDQASMKNTIAVTDDDFDKLVLAADKPVVVDFWAAWCRPCVSLTPILEKLAEDFADRLIIAKVDVEGNPLRQEEFQVRGLPTLLFFHQGKLVKRLMGAMPRARLHTEFEQFLAEIGTATKTVSPEAQAAFDAAVKAAEGRKEAAEKAAGDVFKAKYAAGFAEADAVRCHLLAALADELPAEQADIARRGAAGEFDEEVFKVFVEHRGKIDSEERFAPLQERMAKAVELMNTEESKADKEVMFAAMEAASEQYDQDVEAARAVLNATKT